MKNNVSGFTLSALTLVGAFCSAGLAAAQVAGGTTTPGVTLVESTQLAMGWSVKKTLLGKTIYTDAGQKVGNVDDLIISPEKNVSYVIVGAGGFVGIGRHDVAIPVAQIQDQAGRLVMPGATKDMVKAMPQFNYATDTTKRDSFVAAADKDIARGKAKVADLEKRAGTVSIDAKAKIDSQISLLQGDLKSVEEKLQEMKRVTAARWREFEAGVSTATERLRKSIDSATS
jgi:sporulation protein YlmC with PRC-barrel domain